MFDSFRQSSAYAKVLLIFGIGAGVGFGLCSVGLGADSHGMAAATSIGLMLFLASVAGLLMTALVWVGARIVEAFRR
jgi:hypothetical protein